MKNMFSQIVATVAILNFLESGHNLQADCKDPEGIISILDILSEMKKINHSILVNFMELLDTLVESNSQHEVTLHVICKSFQIV